MVGGVGRLPELGNGSVIQVLHHNLTISNSIASLDDQQRRKKPRKGGRGSDDGSVTPKKGKEVSKDGSKEVTKDDKEDRKKEGICFMALTKTGCSYNGKCKFNHVDPKPSEYSAVKEYILKNSLVARDGVKLE